MFSSTIRFPQAGLMGILANRHFGLHESIPENVSFITIFSEIYPKTTTLKVCITGMASANAAGDKVPMFVIGKARKPRCFKNVKFLPCRHRHQKKSWMDGIMFEEWIRELDRMFLSEGIEVIDNCPAHPHIENLKGIKLFFLPPSTTSITQPMDQGVTRSLKAKYRTNVVRKIIRSLEKNKTFPKISLLHGMQMLVSAWNALTTETIVNCFRKAGISAENQDAAIAEEDDLFKDLQDEIDALQTIQPDLIPEDISAASLVDVYAEVSAAQPQPADAEILADFLKTDNISDDELVDDNDDVEDVPMECPGGNEL